MSHTLPEAKVQIAVKDRNNPNSAINLCPTAISQNIASIPDEYFSLRPDEMSKQFRKDRHDGNGKLIYTKETEVEEKLRIAFWREYDRAVDSNQNMSMERICSGVCQMNVFKKLASNSYRMAYICTPPDDYLVTMQELLTIGLDQLRDILMQPHVDDQGRPLPRMADVKMRIIDSITARVKGAVTHRLETKNLNLMVEADMRNPKSEIGSLTDPDEIDRRLKDLLDSDQKQISEPIDVTPKS